MNRTDTDREAAIRERYRIPAHAVRVDPRQVTDPEIPSGHGTDSLYIGPDGDGEMAVWFKRDQHQRILVMYVPQDAPGQDMPRAVWDILTPLLPTVADRIG